MSQLVMRRPRLDDLPEPKPLPPGYVLRTASVKDAEDLARLLTLAFEEKWSAERVRTILLEAPDVRRTYIVTYGGQVVATASVQEKPDHWPGSGLLHWVGADPSHCGLGLGAAVSLAVLHAHREAGHLDAVLTTDDPRLAAIRTYLRLGFHPLDCDPSHAGRWARVFEQLGGREHADRVKENRHA